MGSETPEPLAEELVEELEGRMHELAKKEDYKAAASIRDELSGAHFDDEVRVLSANAELYSAFSARDMDRMKALWLEAPFVQCIHPYDQIKPCAGFVEVCKSWKRLFKAGKSQRTTISADQVRVNVRGGTATVTCVEQVAHNGQRKPHRRMLATNIFRKVSDRWLLVHRHVSAIDPDIAEMEMDVDIDDLEGMNTWKIAQMAQALTRGNVVIKQVHSDDESNDEDDANHELDQVIGAELNNRMDSDGRDEVYEDGLQDGGDIVEDEVYYEEDGVDLEASREDTVRALRQLSSEGRLSQQAKIMLLSQMLRTPGESIPERAHGLLLTGVADNERAVAWEDFASLISFEAAKLEMSSMMVPRAKARRNKDRRGKR
jgi:translation initiation factor 2A